MLTRQGWAVAIGSVALLAAGRLLGIHELFLLGAGAAALVLAATAYVSLVRLRLDVSRTLHPQRVHAGSASRVELAVRNLGRRRTALLTLRDPIGDQRGASVVLAPLAPGRLAQASYRLPTQRRGIVPVGPLRIEVSDPFGLTTVDHRAAPVTELTVYPAVEDVAPPPHTMGDDPHAGVDVPNALSVSGEEFYALRRYEMGDDLRRVHWRATARHDELMVRQDEMPWQGRSTILLDLRAAAHTAETLERAVSAAASLVMACSRHRFLVRLVSTDGHDSGFAAGHVHIEAVMEHLASVSASDASRYEGMLAALRRSGNGGALVALLGGRAAPDLAGVARLRAAFGSVSAVTFTSGRGAGAGHGGGAGMLVVDDATTFAEAWNTTVRRRRVGAVPR